MKSELCEFCEVEKRKACELEEFVSMTYEKRPEDSYNRRMTIEAAVVSAGLRECPQLDSFEFDHADLLPGEK